jgi:hypothetical protein
MDYLHRTLTLDAGDVVEVYLDHVANVMLIDPSNFALYQARKPFQYAAGGFIKSSPARLVAPEAGEWHLVTDLGGNAGSVRAWLRVVKAAEAAAQTA